MGDGKNPLDQVFGKVLSLPPGREDELRTILDDVFSTPEEQIDTFMDALSTEGVVIDPEASDMSRIMSGRPEAIAAPELSDQMSGMVRIQHGWHDNDYVWHISAWHPKKPFKVSIDRVCYATAKIMNEVIPSSTQVKMWLPFADWDIKEITFKAIDLKMDWSITDEVMNKLVLKLFGVLNALT